MNPKSIPPLLTRLTLATAFLDSGIGKFKHLARDETYFQQLGIPATKVITPFVAAVEVACGSLLALGLFTRAAALPLLPVMGVALGTARRKEFHSFAELTGVFEFSYLLLLSYLLSEGGGELSVDALRGRS